ncbi:tRNA lysidine(34) synthetase TilS [uncultured Sphingomonas sp.]|uniref:tRNA lysidine(34) synthetase TilS n=1 Tax=uncultured Sphingomonas sp. TaxID=158754 RepID=UPI0025CF6142|nr:tRNA lysidine(34) synthetase TilS [uncultured Sphingomonas sp.]
MATDATADDQIARFAADLTLLFDPQSSLGPLLLAVSGGPDSMAMLTLAAAALPGRIAVATVDHGLRPEAADEVRMVAGHCAKLGVPHHALRPATPIEGASIQSQARDARYALLAAQAKAMGAAAILTAHHADDQAETFLMRAARGSGLSGLSGVRARTVIADAVVLRPLLDWRRAELRQIVRRAEAPFVDDPANHDPRHDRTRFRQLLDGHEWLGVAQLARAAAQLAEADGDLRATVDWLWQERAQVEGDNVRIQAADLPRELGRRLVRRAIGTVRRAAGIEAPAWSEASNIEKLLDALMQGSRATQAGVIGSVRSGVWRFRPAPPRKTG